MMRGVRPDDTDKFERLKELAIKAGAAGSKLPTLLASISKAKSPQLLASTDATI
ncbi:MAG: hypothetical protein ABR973_17680 [Candidatus Acidiferrales bacterium]|jgi:hypothetical protein